MVLWVPVYWVICCCWFKSNKSNQFFKSAPDSFSFTPSTGQFKHSMSRWSQDDDQSHEKMVARDEMLKDFTCMDSTRNFDWHKVVSEKTVTAQKCWEKSKLLLKILCFDWLSTALFLVLCFSTVDQHSVRSCKAMQRSTEQSMTLLPRDTIALLTMNINNRMLKELTSISEWFRSWKTEEQNKTSKAQHNPLSEWRLAFDYIPQQTAWCQRFVNFPGKCQPTTETVFVQRFVCGVITVLSWWTTALALLLSIQSKYEACWKDMVVQEWSLARKSSLMSEAQLHMTKPNHKYAHSNTKWLLTNGKWRGKPGHPMTSYIINQLLQTAIPTLSNHFLSRPNKTEMCMLKHAVVTIFLVLLTNI